MESQITEKTTKSKPRKRATYLRLLIPNRTYRMVVDHRNTRMIGKNTIEQSAISLIEMGIAFISKSEIQNNK